MLAHMDVELTLDSAMFDLWMNLLLTILLQTISLLLKINLQILKPTILKSPKEEAMVAVVTEAVVTEVVTDMAAVTDTDTDMGTDMDMDMDTGEDVDADLAGAGAAGVGVAGATLGMESILTGCTEDILMPELLLTQVMDMALALLAGSDWDTVVLLGSD